MITAVAQVWRKTSAKCTFLRQFALTLSAICTTIPMFSSPSCFGPLDGDDKKA